MLVPTVGCVDLPGSSLRIVLLRFESGSSRKTTRVKFEALMLFKSPTPRSIRGVVPNRTIPEPPERWQREPRSRGGHFSRSRLCVPDAEWRGFCRSKVTRPGPFIPVADLLTGNHSILREVTGNVDDHAGQIDGLNSSDTAVFDGELG